MVCLWTPMVCFLTTMVSKMLSLIRKKLIDVNKDGLIYIRIKLQKRITLTHEYTSRSCDNSVESILLQLVIVYIV